MTTTELRVFISSTFRDLREEREHLVKKIFPEIRTLCRQRGVTFTDIDLRWGLTEEEAVLGRVIRTCLEEVDLCRPYFIGIIGNRYGWAPELHEILMDHQLLGNYPWIEDLAMSGASVTEMEFIHGVFDAPPVDGEYAFFYHRAGNPEESDDPARLASLVDRSRNSGKPFREFQSVEELGEHVRADLVAMIDRYWPQGDAPTPLELQRRAHAAFAASRIRAYIPNPVHLTAFTTWVADGRTPLVIHGESGLGKSSLVAWLTDSFRKKNPTAFVIEHFVGAAETSGTAASVMRHVIDEICARFGIDEEIPAREEELQRSFPNWLFRCAHLAKATEAPVMIVIDAVNQLGESGRRLSWLPTVVPHGINMLISTTPGESEDQLRKRPWERLMVAPLGDERVRQSIIVRYLGEFHKGITPEQVRRVTRDPKASSPLYLRVVAEEMRLHGDHETLDENIGRYVDAADLHEVFDRVLERIEHDYGAGPVRELLGAIWASRTGLSEAELMEITGLSRLDLSRLLFAIDFHFVRRDGVLDFFHDYLAGAVEKRYLTDAAYVDTVRETLAACFEKAPPTVRTMRELLWQYGAECEAPARAGRDARLAATLARSDALVLLYHGEAWFDMLRLWAQLAGRGYDAWEAYRRSLAIDADAERVNRGDALAAAAEMLRALNQWPGAAEVYREQIAWGKAHGHWGHEAKGYAGLGKLDLLQSGFAAAMEHFESALELATTHGDQAEMSAAIGYIGSVHVRQGRYAEAMECYRRQRAIAEERGDRRQIARSTGNMGIVHADRGQYAEAIECYGQALAIQEELGDRSGMAAVLSNMGVVYLDQGRYAAAMDSFRQAFAIHEELGDRRGVAMTAVNMGSVHGTQGEFPEAIACFARQLAIAEELGDRREMWMATGNMGILHEMQGDYDQALACALRATEGHRLVGNRRALTHTLQTTASTLLLVEAAHDRPAYLAAHFPGVTDESWRSVTLAHARACAEECVAISDELAKPDTQRAGRILLARMDAALGQREAALDRLAAMLADGTDERDLVDVHYWLWRLGRGAQDAERYEAHRIEALRLYTELHATTPMYRYRKRIEECTIVDGRFQI